MSRTALLALLFLVGAPAGAEEGSPAYSVPTELAGSAPAPPLALRAIKALVETDGDRSEDAWRVLAGLGRPAAEATIRAMAGADWFARAALMTALAESGVPEIEPVLAAGTRDPSWAVREAAVLGLSRIGSADAAGRLLERAGDPSWRVRRAAAVAVRMQVTLGSCPRERAVAALLGLARDEDRDVRLAALHELGNLRAEEARDLLLAGYLDGEERERDVCLDALVRLPAVREDLLAALATAMGSAEDEVFLKAAAKYAELAGARFLDDPARTSRLLRFVRDASGSLVKVTKILDDIGRPAVPLLLADLRELYGPLVALHVPRDPAQPVLDTVQAILGADAAPVLRDILLNWEEALPARRYALVLVRRFHAKALASTLTELFPKESFVDLRSALLQAIEAGGTEDLEPILRAAALDGSSHVRATAQEVLRRHPEMDLADTIAEALGREKASAGLANDWLGLLAARAPDRAFAAAEAMLSSPDPEFRARAAGWVRLGPPDRALPLLVRTFGTEDGRNREKDWDLPEDRLAAVRAKVLAQVLASARVVAGAGALDLLGDAARDPDPAVREKALREAGKIGGAAVTDLALRALARETDPLPIREARRILVASPEIPAREAVAAALRGEDEAARIGYLDALSAVPDAPIPPEVERALAEGAWTPEARIAAIELLRDRKDPARRELFLGLVRGKGDLEVRLLAVQALGDLGDATAVPALLDLLPAEDRDLRDLSPAERQLATWAVSALGEIRSPDAVPRLLALLGAEWPLALADLTEDRRHFDTVVEVLAALGRSGDARAIEPIFSRLFAPEIHRWFEIIRDGQPGPGRNLVGSLVGALVRFPDAALAEVASRILGELSRSGEVWRIGEGYLLHLASLFEDPRIERIARNHPRRETSARILARVLDVAPREGAADRVALDGLSRHAAGLGRFEEAAELRARATRLARLLDPAGFDEEEDLFLAEEDFLRGLGLLRAGREQEGMARFREGLERDPENAEILNLYAWWLAEAGRDLDVALAASVEAGRRSGSAPWVLDTMGWVLHRLGRHEDAAWRLRDAVERDEEEVMRAGDERARRPDPLLRWHLAAAASRAGHLEAAAEWLAAAVGMDDTLAGAARSSADFEPLREKGLLEPALATVPD